MKTIEYFPKFYDRSDVKAKQQELVAVRNELLATGKLTNDEIEMSHDLNLMKCADAYSRNYEIRMINELVSFVQSR